MSQEIKGYQVQTTIEGRLLNGVLPGRLKQHLLDTFRGPVHADLEEALAEGRSAVKHVYIRIPILPIMGVKIKVFEVEETGS